MQIEAHSLHSSWQINLTNFMHEVNKINILFTEFIKVYAFYCRNVIFLVALNHLHISVKQC
jgi:hypothetical protein